MGWQDWKWEWACAGGLGAGAGMAVVTVVVGWGHARGMAVSRGVGVSLGRWWSGCVGVARDVCHARTEACVALKAALVPDDLLLCIWMRNADGLVTAAATAASDVGNSAAQLAFIVPRVHWILGPRYPWCSSS